MNSTYGWIITKDHIADPDAEPGTNANAVGVMGPRNLNLGDDHTKDRATLQNHPNRQHFKMYDDDGELYYEGFFVALGPEDEMHGEEEFGPLEDFGTPNAGAVRIDYRNKQTGKYETL